MLNYDKILSIKNETKKIQCLFNYTVIGHCDLHVTRTVIFLILSLYNQ